MNDELAAFLALCALLSPLTMGFVELVKRQGLPDRLAPVGSVASGLAMMGLVRLAGYQDWSIGETALAGVVTAMIASGVYSGGKALAGKS